MIYKFIEIFYNFDDISLKQEDYTKHNLELNFYMKKIVKYLKWRKYVLCLLLPLLLTDFILNIISFTEIQHNINNYNTSYYGPTLQTNLYNKSKTLNYLKIYTLIEGSVTLLKMAIIGAAYYYNEEYIKSKKIINYYLLLSIIYIYLLYLNPINHYFRFNTHSENILEGNGFTYIVFCMMKQLIPLSVPFFSSCAWSFRNLKIIMPENIYLGWLYKYSLNMFLITGGTLLLVINQFIDNYYISVSILIYIISIFVSHRIYKNEFISYHNINNLSNIIQYNFNIEFMINFALSLGFILALVYFFSYDVINYKGILSYSIIDIVILKLKFVIYIFFYRIFICDNTIDIMLYLEKYKNIIKDELESYNKKMINIEKKLYNDYTFNFNVYNGYNTI